MNYNNILEQIIELAEEAGRAVMGYYNKEYKIDNKNDRNGEESPVTEADLRANEIIIKGLGKYKIPILSEESGDDESRLGQEYVFIVDPLDGTKDFIEKTGDFTIMIGLVKNQKPVLGVICVPARGIVYYGIKDCGSYVRSDIGEVLLKVSDKKDLKDFIMLGSRFHKSELEEEFNQKFNLKDYIKRGSSLKVCQIAEGAGDINFNPSDKMKEWDICASDIILSEAGGRLTNMEGEEFTYNNKDVRILKGYLATNGRIHDKIVDNLKYGKSSS